MLKNHNSNGTAAATAAGTATIIITMKTKIIVAIISETWKLATAATPGPRV